MFKEIAFLSALDFSSIAFLVNGSHPFSNTLAKASVGKPICCMKLAYYHHVDHPCCPR
jgi:hypothetical protein